MTETFIPPEVIAHQLERIASALERIADRLEWVSEDGIVEVSGNMDVKER